MRSVVFSKSTHTCLILMIVMVVFNFGCKRNDIALVAQTPLENQTVSLGKVLGSYSGFTNTTWDTIKGTENQRIVIFTAELNAKDMLGAVAKDSGNWLNMERRYFEYASQEVEKASLTMSFPLSADSFSLEDIVFCISSSKAIACSPGLNDEEKTKMMSLIYENKPEALSQLVPYMNPSLKNGSTLFYDLTGRDITGF